MKIPRKSANLIAALVAGVVFCVGIGLWIGIGPPFDGPKTTTTVVEVGRGSGTGKVTTETTQAPGGQGTKAKNPEKHKGQSKTTTKTVEKPSGYPSGKKTTTTEEGSRSFTERVLGKSGLALLQLGVIILAAFLAAASVQRVLVGDYALKIGPIEIGAAQESKEEVSQKLTADLADTIKALKTVEAELATVSGKQSKTKTKTAKILRSLAALELTVKEGLVAIDERIKELEEPKGVQQ